MAFVENESGYRAAKFIGTSPAGHIAKDGAPREMRMHESAEKQFEMQFSVIGELLSIAENKLSPVLRPPAEGGAVNDSTIRGNGIASNTELADMLNRQNNRLQGVQHRLQVLLDRIEL